MIYIITPCTRVYNLKEIYDSLPKNNTVAWIISYDSSVGALPPNLPFDSDGIEVHHLVSGKGGDYGNPVRNEALEYIRGYNAEDSDWVYVLDDDNILHPNFQEVINLSNAKAIDNTPYYDFIFWNQQFVNGTMRSIPHNFPNERLDTAQYMVSWKIAKNLKFETRYEADGDFAYEAHKLATKPYYLNETLCYYNYLRANKMGDTTRVRICMISMFKNEAKNIRRMLDSVAPYIDYWVLQDNGSTDGTPDIVRQWAEETSIPGKLYQIEEGWVNFGYNRDHVLQTALKEPHGCDWIMKMDCDETLEVDADFDWSIFWTPHQSFHVTAIAPGLMYFRAWIWNAKLPWRFNHDPAHETIYLDDGVTGENFTRVNLPKSFRMITGQSFGESYSVPTKYVTDALKLEEKLIREGTMLQDLYHFWYIGKSYEDCYRGNFFPLKEVHQHEYARRCIFYFTEVVKYKVGQEMLPKEVDEMAYYAMCGIGNAHRFLKEYDKAIEFYNKAHGFCPRRNDHLIYLAEIYWELRDYTRMEQYTEYLMRSDRTCPFPEYFFLINTNMYFDTGSYPQELLRIAKENVNQVNVPSILSLNKDNWRKRLFVVDNFYEDPYMVRDFALNIPFVEEKDWYKGHRSQERFLTNRIKTAFEDITGIKIRVWEEHSQNGRFQYCTPQDLLVYHYDNQTWAGLVYLTPNAPVDTGTSLYQHKRTKLRHADDPGSDQCFAGGFYDGTEFELVDTVGNIFNRLVIFDARCFHAANRYFGQSIQDSRLFHLFFFD